MYSHPSHIAHSASTNKEPDLIGSLQQRWRLFLSVSALVFAIATVVILSLPKRYESFMEFMVNNERPDLVVSPESNVTTVHTSDLSEMQINSEMALLRSADILQPVVLRTGLHEEPGTVQAAGGVSPISLEKALNQLQKDLTIAAVKKSNII
jgi:uncharacterized protein involved in exopolysaccharide biosynthesis